MITWSADNPAAPPPIMQISVVRPLTHPSSRECVWSLSGAVCMRRAQSGRPMDVGNDQPRTDTNVYFIWFIYFYPIRVDPSRRKIEEMGV